ncbi:DEAD/DEAH box helicase [Streptomyces sp. TRM64462]|uniref:DEAD/DEAH box helicase n=1 Tax=Streptomyces sp. TRM64462 TaxID=2741726 RepID=UPI0015865926|nr:DEAD/DEAH box helicase [Streptomyces sp. TRM64462]
MAARSERQRRADIVRYWRAVEMFSPQKVDKVAPARGMYAVDAGRPLPWEPGHPVRRRPPGRNMVWQHTVYCGVYAVSAVRDVLIDVFGGSEEDHEGRLDGDTALLAFDVTDDGLLVQDSITFSACAWATGRSRKPGPGARGWLDGFEDEAEACERVVLDIGDGKLEITEVAPTRRQRPFAGLLCEIALGAVGGAATAALGPGLGDVAAGAVRAALDAATDGSQRGRRDAGATRTPNPDDGAQAEEQEDDGAEGPPRLGEKPLTVRDLSAVTRWVADQFGVTDDLRPEIVRVQSRAVSRRKAGRSGGSDFLNSFIAADLGLVAGRIAQEEPGKALRDYLTATVSLRTATRVDVKEDTSAVLRGVEPARFPLGRWPGKSEHPLVRSQQFAVNAIMRELADGEGLYAVNGPPGTGKTTQLRDLIAAVLVQRAERLAELSTPDDAFTGTVYRWRTGAYQRSVRALKPSLTGHEMVIASANNGAVENVSLEIPALDSVAEEWQEQTAYFPVQGRLILDGEPAWGAVAARLGNKGNRSDFRAAYWFGPPREERAERGTGMRELLREAAERRPGPEAWRQAVAEFRQARRTVQTLRDERQRIWEALVEAAGIQDSVDAAQRRAAQAERDVDTLRAPVRQAAADRDSARRLLDAAAAHRAEHHMRRPGIASGIFTLGAAQREWLQEDRTLADAEESARRRYEDHERTAATQARAEHAARAALDEARGLLRTLQQRQSRLEGMVADALRRWGAHIPGVEEQGFPGRTREDAEELSSPWSDAEFTRARTRLFIAAMDLHRAFLEGAADRMRKNLDAAMDVVCGDAPKTLRGEVVLAAWQSLFLALPVVSTTFASLDRMFTGLGPGSLGWMLIDEAGQATPQMPVGALWRARRAVIVGDPLQLEPVVTLPHTGQQALRRTFGVDEEWAPSRTSAQRVADRLNRYGTWLPGQEERVWVGSPLRVHRRCDDPMFTISNSVAYDGLMVHGVHRTDEYEVARRSVWWPVSGGRAPLGKWCPDEGDVAKVIVHRLVDRGLDPERDLFVISPFRDVVAGLGRTLCRAVPRDRIGTVHTTQGKEADVVLLVLGAGGDKAGPRAWAASAPNLLNVAVSRARRRLFVVGDHEAWRRHPHFDVMAGQLHRMPEEERDTMRAIAPAVLPEHCRCG